MVRLFSCSFAGLVAAGLLLLYPSPVTDIAGLLIFAAVAGLQLAPGMLARARA